jgi:hypothetical protein
MYAVDRTCCVCTEAGKAVQIHHIDDNPANNEPENLAVLCLECHNDTQAKGGFGRRLDAALVRYYRNNWVARVANRRHRADELASLRSLGLSVPSTPAELRALGPPSGISVRDAFEEYVSHLPALRAQAIAQARPQWERGSTVDMIAAAYEVTNVYMDVMVRLASWSPKRHFGSRPASFFDRRINALYKWHRLRIEVDPPGSGGTIVGPLVARAVMRDAAQMVVEMVEGLISLETPVDEWDRWCAEWERSRLE